MSATVTPRPTLQDLIKSASEGTFAKVAFNEEARRHLGELGSSTKTASVAEDESISTDFIHKLAKACDAITAQITKEAADNKQGIGRGPNASEVSETKGGAPISEDSGKAHDQPPAAAVEGTKMVNDEHKRPGGGGKQEVKMAGEKMVEDKGHEKAEMAKLDKIEKKVEDCPKEASALLARLEKAANSTSAKSPEGVSDSSQPHGSVSPHVGSNEAAMNIKPRDAQAKPKADMKTYIDEPMQTSSTDKVLNNAFTHTGEAGAKIASADVDAAKELLARLTGKVA